MIRGIYNQFFSILTNPKKISFPIVKTTVNNSGQDSGKFDKF